VTRSQPWVWQLAAYGLPDHTTLSPAAWGPRFDELFRHGLAGLLADAAANHAATLSDAEARQLHDRLDREAHLAVRLEAELIRLEPVLERHDAVVIKGAALAHGAYDAPHLRPFSDLDLLVASSSITQVLRDLERFGYQRPRPDPAPGYAARVAKATALTHPSGLIVDLHRTLATGTAAHRVDVEYLVANRISIVAGRVQLPAPSWPAHLIEACLHAVIGDGLGRALSVRDVAQIAALPQLNAAEAVRLARSWQVDAPVSLALRAARELLGASLPLELNRAAGDAVGQSELDPIDARAASAQRRLDDVRHSGDLRSRATLVRSLVAPTPRFLRWTYGPGPLPRLYLRRWSDLRRRTADAGARS